MSSNNPAVIKVAHPCVGEEESAAVREVLLSGRYASGPRVEEFEKRFAEYTGVGHAVAVNSGTAALHIALESLGIGEGDEVVVPPMTFFATVSSVLYLRAVPVFADIDPDDLCLSPESVDRVVTPRTKAVVPVHLFGAAAKMDRLMDVAHARKLKVVEDCAQAHGSTHRGRKVGSIGHAGAFSFFATKHMTTGEGGMITTDDPEVAEQARCIRSHGMAGRDDHVRLGFNNRMTEIEAAIGLVQLAKLDDLNAARVANSERILEAVRAMPWAEVPVPKEATGHTYFWCPVMVRKDSGRGIEELKEHLAGNGIEFRRRYAEPLHRQPVLAKLGLDYSRVRLPNAERLAGNVIGLPNHPGLDNREVARIIDVLRGF